MSAFYSGPDENVLVGGVIAWDDPLVDAEEFELEMNAAILASALSTVRETEADYVLWENQLGYMAFARSLDLAYSAYAIGSDLDSVITTLEFLRVDPEQFVITE